MSNLQNQSRIYNNLKVLLDGGVFAGSTAAALAEAQQHVAAMCERLAKDLKDAEEAKDGNSVRAEADTGGMADGQV